MLDFLLVFNLPKLVFDDEMCGQALRFVREVKVAEDLPVDALIDQLMADQHLIMADHTMAHWPTELYLPSSIVDRDNRENWTKAGGKDTDQRAVDEVDRRLAALPADRDGPADRRRAAADHPLRPRDPDRAAGAAGGRGARGRGRIGRASPGEPPPRRSRVRLTRASPPDASRRRLANIEPSGRTPPLHAMRVRRTRRRTEGAVDRRLVELAQRGDEDAFDALVRATGDRCLGIAYRILRDVDLAEDAVQATYVRAWRELRSLREPDRFESWLHRTLTRVCYEEARRTRRLAANIRALPSDTELRTRRRPRCRRSRPAGAWDPSGFPSSNEPCWSSITTSGSRSKRSPTTSTFRSGPSSPDCTTPRTRCGRRSKRTPAPSLDSQERPA